MTHVNANRNGYKNSVGK